MEKYIDLINAYLQKTLSESEVLAFENKLQSDSEFNTIYKEHLVFLKGIERVDLIQEISDAKQSYVRGKWLKYLGISIGIILISILAISLISKTQNVENTNLKENNTVEYITDSITKENNNPDEVMVDTDSIKKVISQPKQVLTSEKEVEAGIIEKQIVDRKISNKNDLITFFNLVKKQPQIIKVNTEEDFKITLKEGTKISIPKNAFIDAKTGKQASGKIDLNITEYYKLSDILLADLSTKSNSKLLETGGMLYVEARKNGSKLKLSPENKMNIIFNTSGKPNMQLFEGEKNSDNINWELNKQETVSSETDEIAFVMVSLEEDVIAFQSVEKVPVFPGCENGNNDERKECMNAAINKLVNSKFNLSIAEDLKLTGTQKIRTSFEFDEKGNVGKIRARASHKSLAEEAIRVIELLPQVIPGQQKGKPIAVSYSLPIDFRLEGETIDQPSVTIKSDRAFQGTFEAKSIASINNSDIERYTFATTNLGWINCDRFVNSRKKKIKYKLKIADAEGSNVKLIFKSISSVLHSIRINDDYSFGEIPIDEDVVLLAIKKKGNKLFLGMKEAKIKAISEMDLEFKEVTITQLKAELKKLNKDF